MEKYKNLGGNSGVAAFEINPGSIKVQFNDQSRSEYLYTNQSTGVDRIAEMQRLAKVGRGLNTYITTVVKKNYAQKLR